MKGAWPEKERTSSKAQKGREVDEDEGTIWPWCEVEHPDRPPMVALKDRQDVSQEIAAKLRNGADGNLLLQANRPALIDPGRGAARR